MMVAVSMSGLPLGLIAQLKETGCWKMTNPGVFTMRNNVLSYLLLPLFASLSFSLSAAPASTTAVAEPVPVVTPPQAPQQGADLAAAEAAEDQQQQGDPEAGADDVGRAQAASSMRPRRRSR